MLNEIHCCLGPLRRPLKKLCQPHAGRPQRSSPLKNTIGLKNTYPAAISKTPAVFLIAAGYVFFNPNVFLQWLQRWSLDSPPLPSWGRLGGLFGASLECWSCLSPIPKRAGSPWSHRGGGPLGCQVGAPQVDSPEGAPVAPKRAPRLAKRAPGWPETPRRGVTTSNGQCGNQRYETHRHPLLGCSLLPHALLPSKVEVPHYPKSRGMLPLGTLPHPPPHPPLSASFPTLFPAPFLAPLSPLPPPRTTPRPGPSLIHRHLPLRSVLLLLL